MQKSNLPEGTVFIAVGAILGFMGAAVLAWRGIIAWSLQRSVRRAALGTHQNDSMLKLTKPNLAHAPTHSGSTHSLERLSAPTGKLSKQSHTHAHSGPSFPSASTRNSSLFFSPTAGAGHHSSPTAAMMASNNRTSAYLPAGYYAAPGAAAPASGAGTTSVGSGAASALSSLNPMHPSHRGYRPQHDVSPPDTPYLPPTRGNDTATRGHHSGGYERVSGYGGQTGGWQSSSTLNLHVPGGNANGGRAPSANLEDLFEHHGNGMMERF